MAMQVEFLDLFLRDLVVGSSYLIAFILGIIAWGLYRKSAGRISGTLGLSIYFITFSTYVLLTSFSFLYVNLEWLISIGAIFWVLGILALIFTIERDYHRDDQKSARVTVLSAVFVIVSAVIVALGYPFYIVFIGLSIAIVYITWQFLDMISELETTRRNFPALWFVIGIVLSGLANFILIFSYDDQGFLLKNLMILVGGICLAYSWWGIPSVEDFDWLLTLERLLVVESVTSLPLVDFTFRRISKESRNGDTEEKSTDGLLVASAMSGIDTLIGEILANSGGLDEITLGAKTILFHRRVQFTCVLIAERSMKELRYRLESFGLKFENQYPDDLEAWDGKVSRFSKVDALIREIFG